MLIINADDWGRSEEITGRILECHLRGRIHSASAMTFMRDSERAASIALQQRLPTGLHLNLSQEFTGENVPETLRAQHLRIAGYLNRRKYNQVLYNPLVRNALLYAFRAQWDEYTRLYGEQPGRLDGHHHMHLCLNALVSLKLPRGMRIRRNFSFSRGEKGPVNRLYRYLVDRRLRSRYSCTDYFFSLEPIRAERLERIRAIARCSDVELMVHPGVGEEYEFLLGPEWERMIP